MKHKVTAVTDGGCEPNPGVGGWGVVLRCGEHYRELCGVEAESTNNRMELTAAIEALKALKEPCEVLIISDSQYLVYTMTRGWKRKLNHDLWDELDRLCAIHQVTWKWVRGHNGHTGNERAHELSMQAIRMMR